MVITHLAHSLNYYKENFQNGLTSNTSFTSLDIKLFHLIPLFSYQIKLFYLRLYQKKDWRHWSIRRDDINVHAHSCEFNLFKAYSLVLIPWKFFSSPIWLKAYSLKLITSLKAYHNSDSCITEFWNAYESHQLPLWSCTRKLPSKSSFNGFFFPIELEITWY